MRKLVALLSSVMCLFLASGVEANEYFQPYYADQCVGRCQDPCVGQCPKPWWDGRFYAGAFGAANWQHYHCSHHIRPKMKLGYAAAFSLGYKFNSGFRIEGEVAYRRNHLKHKDWISYGNNDWISYGSDDHFKISGYASSWSYMANFLYDFDHISCYFPNIVPYVGLGVGYTHVHAHIKAHNDGYEHISCKGKGNGVAGQAIAGVSYYFTDSTSLGVEYRYFVGKEHARDHSVGLALRQSF